MSLTYLGTRNSEFRLNLTQRVTGSLVQYKIWNFNERLTPSSSILHTYNYKMIKFSKCCQFYYENSFTRAKIVKFPRFMKRLTKNTPINEVKVPGAED